MGGGWVNTTQPLTFSPSTNTDPYWLGTDERRDIESALSSLDPSMEYDGWLKIGMALHNAYEGSEEGLGLFDDWSAESGIYKEQEPRDKWRSFSNDTNGSKVSIKTLFKMARANGWTNKIVGIGPKYPHTFEQKGGAIKVLGTRGNLEALMEFYDVTTMYDVIKLRLNITNINSLQGEQENSLIAFLKSKCGLHGLNKGVVDDQLTAITQNSVYNPVTTWLQNIERTKTHNPIVDLVDSLPVKNQAWAKVAFYRWFIQCVAAADRAAQTPNKGRCLNSSRC